MRIWIRDLFDPGTEFGINIPDPQHWQPQTPQKTKFLILKFFADYRVTLGTLRY
jgi:hypothetical protein